MELDFADVKPTVLNAIIITLMIAITVPLLKWVTNKYNVFPPFTQLVNSI